MSYSIPSSTKILNPATAPVLFVLFSALSVCKFAMVPGVYIFLYPLEEENTLLPEGTDIYIYKHKQGI